MQPLLLLRHSFGVLVPLLGWGEVEAGVVGTYAAATGFAEAAGSAALARELGLLAPLHSFLISASSMRPTSPTLRCIGV